MITDALRRAYQRDGVCLLEGVLSPDSVAALLSKWTWSMDNPGPLASGLLRDGSDAHQDLCNPHAAEQYCDALIAAGVGNIAAQLWQKPDVWFMYEQVFHKSGGAAGRTPWHQDLSYLAVNGNDLLVMWITFEPVPSSLSLEFVKGSHLGTLYDGTRFDPADPTIPLYGDGTLPRLPDIQSSRDAYDIVSFDTKPGDVVLFHPATLHGGGPTTNDCPERRTLTLRFFGEDAVYDPRPGPAGPFYESWKGTLQPGDPFRHERFLKLH